MAKRSYSADERAAILQTARDESPAVAVRKHGVPHSTLSIWRRDSSGAVGSEPVVEATPTRAVVTVPDAPPPADHSRNGRHYGPAERKTILETAQRLGPKGAAAKHGCSTWSIHHWRREAKRQAAAFGTGTVTRPAELLAEVEDRQKLILDTWRTNPGFGPSQVRNQMRRKGYKVSTHTVRRILLDNGYIPPVKRAGEPSREFEVARPMQLYHLDFLHFYVHKQKVCLLLIEDDYSRFIAGWALLTSEQADPTIDALQVAMDRYGKPESVMVDRGSAFFSFRGVARFESFVTEADIDYYPAEDPEENGKVERLNFSVRKELLTKVEFADLDDALHRIRGWIAYYNYRRTHQALGGLLVPADRFHGLAEEALRRIEQGNDASPLDVLTPRDRALDVLRVTSIAGQVTVYLMGHKIFASA